MGVRQKARPACVAGVCLVDVKLGNLSPNAKILKQPPIFHEAKTKFYIINSQPFSYQVAIHSSCICNERLALYNRHCIDRSYLRFDKLYWKRATKIDLPFKLLEPMHPGKIANCYTGPKRVMYRNAWQSFQHSGLLRKHYYVSMFIKPDKYSAGDIHNKSPRAIQYRAKEYNLLLASYLKPVEEFVYEHIEVNGTRCIAKGLSPVARGLLFTSKVSLFDDPVFFEIDHSKFDSTVRVEHLKSLHKYYKKFYPKDARLNRLLQAQIHNKGMTKNFIKYRVSGTRMSGDFDTGLGNSLINFYVLTGWLKLCNFTKFDILLDGDDSIIIVERDQAYKARPELFERFGFETKFRETDDIHDVEFCQSKLMTTPLPNFVRNPLRAMSHTNISLKCYDPVMYRRWIAGVGMCELSLNPGVPILQRLGQLLAMTHPQYYIEAELRVRMAAIKPKFKFYPVTDLARYQFFRCFGIEPAMQEVIEQNLTGPTYPKREVQDSVGYTNEPTTGSVLWAASTYATLGTSLGQCWSTLGRGCL